MLKVVGQGKALSSAVLRCRGSLHDGLRLRPTRVPRAPLRRTCAGGAAAHPDDDRTEYTEAEINAHPPPTAGQLRRYAFQCAVPMIGFGFVDNLIMIQAGELIDETLGVRFGLATLTAAAMGQVCSDVSGVVFGGFLDAMFEKMGLPPHRLSPVQFQQRIVRFVRISSSALGVVFGCFLGMGSLLFMDLEHEDRVKKQSQLTKIFNTLAEDGKNTLNVERITLQILDQDGLNLWTMARRWTPTPQQIAENLRDMTQRMKKENSDVVTMSMVHQGFMALGWENADLEIILPQETFTLQEYEEFLSKQLACRPVKTPLKKGGTKWHVMNSKGDDVLNLEDIYFGDNAAHNKSYKKISAWRAQTMLIGALLDPRSREPLGVIEMINKKDDHGDYIPFTQADEKFMQLLCSHCSHFIDQATNHNRHMINELLITHLTDNVLNIGGE